MEGPGPRRPSDRNAHPDLVAILVVCIYSFFIYRGSSPPYPTDLEMRSGLLGQMSNLPTNGVNGHLPGDALAAGRLPDVLAPQYPWQTNDISMNMLPPNHSNDFLMESLGPNKENEDDVEVMSTDSSSSSSDSDNADLCRVWTSHPSS
ncbi:unnamed protein product [Ranitomeya imitator]|uniref:Mediator of RNA polymerase II transcription subunit 4 n=1 Tax=Ranitomeya imitator TaxID=111125 RepID=A0ABN9LCE5_9NEOB|nr:unnamed protein product [Ranitomeya imitator]